MSASDVANTLPGAVVIHRSGSAHVLDRRKTGDDATPLPGWWLVDGGGLADRALASDEWRLLDIATVRRLWDEDDGTPDEGPVERAVVEALMEVGGWDEIDGDGDPASILADHIRRLPDRLAARLREEHHRDDAADALELLADVIREATDG